jgi:NADPH:quinone reductase-like Zn-dependent oxidoreductase
LRPHLDIKMTEVAIDESKLGDTKGKVAIVTDNENPRNFKIKRSGELMLIAGGASGIGQALVELLHSRGSTVVFGDVNVSAGERIAKDLGT